MQRVKMSKKKNDQADAKWRHSTEAVEKGKITYNCKFLGSTPVSQSKGSELIKEAIKKLQFANDIKKSEEGLKASKLKKVELCISVNNLVVTDIKSKSTLYSFPLQRISYCADDKSSKRLFGFIARERESPQHHCYVLESEKNAEELTLAVGQAFDIAYRKFKANQAAGDKKVDEMQKRVASTEKENELLKKRLDELERAQKGANTPPAPRAAMPVAATSENLIQGENGFTPAPSNSVQPTFDPFSESGTIGFDSNSGPANSGPIETSQASNPFAAIAQEKPESNQGDLLHMFGASNSPVTPQQDDIFDPLAQVNGLSSTQENIPQQMPKSSSFEEAPSPQNEMPAAPVMPVSVSRPKSTGLSGGLLPPPPTKQSIKERNKSSISQGEQANTPSPVPEVGGDSNQGVKELQDGVENNLVLF